MDQYLKGDGYIQMASISKGSLRIINLVELVNGSSQTETLWKVPTNKRRRKEMMKKKPQKKRREKKELFLNQSSISYGTRILI